MKKGEPGPPHKLDQDHHRAGTKKPESKHYQTLVMHRLLHTQHKIYQRKDREGHAGEEHKAQEIEKLKTHGLPEIEKGGKEKHDY